MLLISTLLIVSQKFYPNHYNIENFINFLLILLCFCQFFYFLRFFLYSTYIASLGEYSVLFGFKAQLKSRLYGPVPLIHLFRSHIFSCQSHMKLDIFFFFNSSIKVKINIINAANFYTSHFAKKILVKAFQIAVSELSEGIRFHCFC